MKYVFNLPANDKSYLDYFMAFIEGFIVGLGMIIFLGPVFFQLLQASLEYGIKAGMAVVFGIFFSDVLVVLLCHYGLKDFFSREENQFWMALVGIFVLLFLGIKYLFQKKSDYDGSIHISVANFSGFFIKGFAVNFVNPFVFVVWISTMTYARSKYVAADDISLFFTAALLGILLTDSLKVILAGKLRPLLQGDLLLKIFKVIGLILIGFAVRLIFFVMK